MGNNLLGLDLKIDDELITSAVRESIVSAVAASLSNSDQIVKQFVNSLFSEKVNSQTGEISRYSSDPRCSRIEYYVRRAICDETRNVISEMVDECRPMIKHSIKDCLINKNTLDGLAEAFVDSVCCDLKNVYSTKVDITFSKVEDTVF